MTLCKVTGTVVATMHHPSFDGHKLLLCQPLESGKPQGAPIIAVDRVQAGIGDTVLVNREGGGNRLLLQQGANVPIRSLVVAIVDQVESVGP